MRKLITFITIMISLSSALSANAWWNYDSRDCQDRCSGNHYEEPFCPQVCGGYKRYSDGNYFNGYYPNGYGYPTYYYNNTYVDQNMPGYYCAAYDNGNYNGYYDNGYNNSYYNNGYYNNGYYYYNSFYSNYPQQNFCDCRGRDNCTCTFYPSSNGYNSSGYVRRCIDWRRY